MKKTMLALLIPFLYPLGVVDGEGGAAADPGAGGGEAADTSVDKGGDKDLSLRDELSANIEIQEKGPEANDLSDAARRLAAARKGKIAQTADDPAAKAKADADAKAKQDGEAKAKRDAELAKLAPEERAKAEAEDKRKADEVAAGAKLEAPAHWPAAAREMFAKQPQEARAFLLDRHKAMEADYTKKMQELAPIRRLNDELDETFKPHEEMMRQAGMTRAQAIRELVGWKERLDKDPAAAFRYLAEIRGVDLKKTIAGEAAADPAGESPTVQALRTQVTELTTKLSKLTDGQSAQQQHAQLSQVTAFAEEKDAQGQLKHPHFDEVSGEIAALLKSGLVKTLQDAYDRAVHANPATREKLLAAKDAERRAKEEAERKAKAEAARKAAAANITGEGAATHVAAQTGSVREDLEAAFASAGDRV